MLILKYELDEKVAMKNNSSVVVISEEKFNWISKCDNIPFKRIIVAQPKQSNFNGRIYKFETLFENLKQNLNVEWNEIEIVNFFDVTSFVSTHSFDHLDENIDICSFSLYKIFGMPTSIGGLIIRRQTIQEYTPDFFGGGTVKGWLPTEDYLKYDPTDKLSYGTEPYIEYANALVGLKTWLDLTGGIENVQNWTSCCTEYALDKMEQLGIFKFYRQSTFEYGPIITFNGISLYVLLL